MKPKVVLYTATSLDGHTTGFPVDLSLFYTLARQFGEDASLVGSDTLLAAPDEISEDDGTELPLLMPRADDPRPILVVPDSRGRLRSWHYWRSQPYWKDFVALCTERTPREHRAYLERSGIKSITAGAERVEFGHALELLNAQFQTTVVRVDSGGTLNGVLLRAGLVDEVHLLVHPILVGGTGRRTFFQEVDPANTGTIQMHLLASKMPAPGIVLLSYAVSG